MLEPSELYLLHYYLLTINYIYCSHKLDHFNEHLSHIYQSRSKNLMYTTFREGHSTIVDELVHQLGRKPDAIVCSVGGGGLMTGLVLGTKRVGWSDVPLVSMETVGADSFYKSTQENRVVTLPGISR